MKKHLILVATGLAALFLATSAMAADLDARGHGGGGSFIGGTGGGAGGDIIFSAPDGGVLRADGTVVRGDGTIIKRDGTVITADGTIIRADGSVSSAHGGSLAGHTREAARKFANKARNYAANLAASAGHGGGMDAGGGVSIAGNDGLGSRGFRWSHGRMRGGMDLYGPGDDDMAGPGGPGPRGPDGPGEPGPRGPGGPGPGGMADHGGFGPGGRGGPPPVVGLRQATYDWTGGYVGLWAGAACMNGNLLDRGTSQVWLAAGCGLEGGALMGYNVEMDNVVLGAEIDAGRTTTLVTNADPGASFTLGLDYEVRARGRLGWAIDDTLIYLAAGGVLAQGNINAVAPFTTPSNLTARQFGWTVGLGVEHAFTNNFRMRLEYDYTHMVDTDYQQACCNVNVHWGDEHEARMAAIFAF